MSIVRHSRRKWGSVVKYVGFFLFCFLQRFFKNFIFLPKFQNFFFYFLRLVHNILKIKDVFKSYQINFHKETKLLKTTKPIILGIIPKSHIFFLDICKAPKTKGK